MSCLYDIGLAEALHETLTRLAPLPPIELPISQVYGLLPARDAYALVDCPTLAVSTKDGYAVRAADLASVRESGPCRLRITGAVAAGSDQRQRVAAGTAVQVNTGAPVPEGADAVLPMELTCREGDFLVCLQGTTSGRNVQPRGHEVARGDAVARAGVPLTPAGVGLLAAAGQDRLLVQPQPRVAIVATGDEVVAPGAPLRPGQVYASNASTLSAWLHHFGMAGSVRVVGDDPPAIVSAIREALAGADALLTSGGAWMSERDFMTRAVTELGAELHFHRVRMGPGKAVAFSSLGPKPLFCLAGGPLSNEMGLLQIALPALLRLAGRAPRPFLRRRACLTATVGGDRAWTQLFHARLEQRAGALTAYPLQQGSRLQTMAVAEAIIRVPEGVERIGAGEQAEIEVLFPGVSSAEVAAP